jgi:hypothetical protein
MAISYKTCELEGCKCDCYVLLGIAQLVRDKQLHHDPKWNPEGVEQVSGFERQEQSQRGTDCLWHYRWIVLHLGDAEECGAEGSW